MTQIYTPTFLPFLNEGPSLYQPRQDQYTRKSLPQTISHSSSHPSQHLQRNGKEIRRPRSPIPEIHTRTPSLEDLDMYQTRPDTNQKREQLPPLSSLFGSPSHPPSSVPTTYASGQTLYPPASPRHPATPSHSERPYDVSYVQRQPIPRPYSSNSRPEQVERLGLPPPPRPSQFGIRPESPRQDPRYYSEGHRSHGPTSVNAWSPRSQSNRPDYFSTSRDTSSSFRPHHEHLPQPMIQRREPEPRIIYHEQHQAPPLTPLYPPTPTSTVAGEQTTTKDGLGPKIWTGTQFLPRFVKQAEVPGEGMCYFYDDGTHCKTVIDGEIVNAHWGVTKAGKPRKRLAIACITCREKKIKCDPDYPRCVQCEKFGRICKFKNA